MLILLPMPTDALWNATAADCILKWGAKLLSSNDSVRTILGGARHPRMFG